MDVLVSVHQVVILRITVLQEQPIADRLILRDLLQDVLPALHREYGTVAEDAAHILHQAVRGGNRGVAIARPHLAVADRAGVLAVVAEVPGGVRDKEISLR